MPTMQELQAQADEQHARMQKQVFVKDGHIVLKVKFEYKIDIDRCRTYDQIVGWTLRLCEKNWLTTELLEQFILVACHENGLVIPHP